MLRGLYTSALGMITQMQRMDVVTNNIANVDTTAFKRDQVVSHSFTEEVMKRLDDPGRRMFHAYRTGEITQGVFVDDIYTDFTAGAVKPTGAPLDIALVGSGFFCVEVTDINGQSQMLYTRDGSLSLLPDGTLVTLDGGVVQGQNGAIVLPNGNIAIDEQGAVYVNDRYIDTLKTVDFEDKHTLRKRQDNYYAETAESVQIAFSGKVTQGYLEGSNVSSVKEMVEMIALSRAYEINARMITVHDTTLGRAVNDIARK